MTLTGIHFILTYTCTRECDHCFIYGSPKARGKFTIEQIKKILKEGKKIGTIEIIYFEGEEPFLAYSEMLEGIKLSREFGFEVGIVTNGYWAKNEEVAKRLLIPIVELGIANLSISDDDFHLGNQKKNPAKIAANVARNLGLPIANIAIANPTVSYDSSDLKGKPIIGGGVRFRGRAVEKLSADLPKRIWKEFDYCPHEELVNPERVHIDPFGNVFLCQGISLGNINQIPLSDLIHQYNLESHPIFNFIEKGGPARLAEEYGIQEDQSFVDDCHLCFTVRKNLLTKYPVYLSPKYVYGIK